MKRVANEPTPIPRGRTVSVMVTEDPLALSNRDRVEFRASGGKLRGST